MDKIMADYDKNKKLLEELKNATDKLKKEDLDNNLEKLQQNFKSQAKSLEQLVELTKKYYAERKAEQIADKLNTLAKDQEKLSNTQTPNPKENQEAINKQFDKIKEELNDLQRDNKDLKAPLDLPKDDALKNEIDKNLNDAKQELEKNQSKSASSKQKAAAKNMQSLSDKISSSLEGSASEQLEEDVKMLRQVLDNLLTFSNTQEDVMRQLSKLSPNSSGFNKRVKLQQDLKVQFKHIDDSLFTLSLRNPKFSDLITKEVGDIQYNLNQSISSFTASKVSKSLSHQQYVVASSNKLGDFLSDLLNNLQMQMSGASGASGGKPKPGNKGMQLPDIIQMQKALGEKVGKGISSKPGDGNKPGSSGSGANGSKPSSTPSDENSSEALLAIYKEQRQLRDQLEKLLSNNPKLANGRAILDKMKAAEAEILNKGFNNQLLSKLLNINQELLKLKNATQLQEEDSSRQSNNGSNKQNNNANSLPKDVLDYINSIEILNRQSLPLQNNFNRKVQDYFNTND